jgi:hypothetical protein
VLSESGAIDENVSLLFFFFEVVIGPKGAMKPSLIRRDTEGFDELVWGSTGSES